ncbi:MAG TPA: DinB family protein [Chitinophagales bacterium]|nr:DinB family protein [Chitinophagales bacterium]
MQPVANHVLIDALEQSVESHLQQAVRVFQNMDEDALQRPSPAGGWSIAQCLWHLNSYGQYYLPRIGAALEQAPENGNGVEHFKSGRLGNYFTRMMEPGKSKYKVNKRHLPPAVVSPHQTVAEFIQQQETLLHYLRKARAVNLNKIRLPISIASLIKLKLGDVLQFVVAHNERHIQQALRNLAENREGLESPAAAQE